MTDEEHPNNEAHGEEAEQAGAGGRLSDEARAEIKAAIEAVLFAAQDPLSTSRIAGCIRGADGRLVRSLLKEIAEDYRTSNRGFQVEEVAGGFRLYSRPDLHQYVEKMFKQRQAVRLSPAAVETLAIVAYKQPVTRAEVEDIRGVATGPILRNLLDLSLIKIAGRAEVLGRPLLYGTTKKFLEHFGLKSLADLPRSEDFQAAAEQEEASGVSAEDMASVALRTALETAEISPDGAELEETEEGAQ